jgi:8-oxo-dGTP pyrophosphatase MutT (NUDIX family)
VTSSTPRTRSYTPVENPADRPRVSRTTVRVLLLNPDGDTLLFEDSDPGLNDTRWWVTPGGGIDPGETETQAAVREVAEETGFVLSPDDLLGPVARRHVVHGYSDQVIEQDEAFYLAQVETFDVDVSAHTAEEQITFKGYRWFSTEDLRTTDDWVWPRELEEILLLIDTPERWPVDLGVQEESTVLDVSE